MSWMAPCDELGDRREPVGLGNSVGSNADAALTFKAVHGRVGNEPLDRAARERKLDAVTELHCGVSLARKPIRGKPLILYHFEPSAPRRRRPSEQRVHPVTAQPGGLAQRLSHPLDRVPVLTH